MTVLISPLCATMRYGCASGHSGKVLVEKRWCTSASAETHARILQVLVVLPDLVGQQQALVDDRAADMLGT